MKSTQSWVPGGLKSLVSAVLAVAALLPAATHAQQGYGGGVYGGPVQGVQNQSAGQGGQRYTFPDRSGSVVVPAGWKVSSATRGAVDMVGPNSELLALGIALPIFTYAMPGYQGIASPYLAPVQAFPRIMGQFAGKMGLRLQITRVIEAQQTAPVTGSGQSVFMMAEASLNGRAMKVFALASSSPIGGDQWLFYTSYVMAPAEVFDRSFGGMLDIWKSWGISQGEINKRLEAAANSMAEARRILASANANTSKAYDRSNRAFSDYIRGDAIVQDHVTGRRTKMSLGSASALVKNDPTRYSIVPGSQYGD